MDDNPPIYRRATPEDVNKVLELNSEFLNYTIERGFKTDFEKNNIDQVNTELKKRVMSPTDNTPVFVVEKDDDVRGYTTGIIVTNDPSFNSILENVILTKDFRGGGMGKGLVQQFIELCKMYKAKKVVVEPWKEDQDAIGFYTAIGFTKSKDSSNDIKKVLYELTLS